MYNTNYNFKANLNQKYEIDLIETNQIELIRLLQMF